MDATMTAKLPACIVILGSRNDDDEENDDFDDEDDIIDEDDDPWLKADIPVLSVTVCKYLNLDVLGILCQNRDR